MAADTPFLRSSELDPSVHRAVLLFSGGFDSTLTALELKRNRIPTIALSLDFTERPRREIATAEALAGSLAFEQYIHLALPISDRRTDQRADYRREAWFPYKNVIFFSMAAHIAMYHGCNVISAGIRAWDSPDFDDASYEYLSSLGELLQYCGYSESSGKLKLFVPLMTEPFIAESALLVGDEATKLLLGSWSCWRDGDVPCGECSPCMARDEFIGLVNDLKKDLAKQ